MNKILPLIAALALAVFSGSVLAKGKGVGNADFERKGNGYGHCKAIGKGHHKDKHHGWSHENCDDEPVVEPEPTCVSDVETLAHQFSSGPEGESYTAELTHIGVVCSLDEGAFYELPALVDDGTRECLVDYEISLVASDPGSYWEDEESHGYDINITQRCDSVEEPGLPD
ncbi:MAG: hypothetical protein WDZ76_10715 [Pseudohongiellaceae bacterium]